MTPPLKYEYNKQGICGNMRKNSRKIEKIRENSRKSRKFSRKIENSTRISKNENRTENSPYWKGVFSNAVEYRCSSEFDRFGSISCYCIHLGALALLEVSPVWLGFGGGLLGYRHFRTS